MYIEKSYELGRTGKLRQYYTLYQCVRVSAEHFCRESRVHVKNLAFDLNIAVSKAQEIAGSDTLDVYESEREIIDNFYAFGLKWNKSRKCYYATLDKKFWEVWKSKKCELKEQGFYVTKSERYGFTVFSLRGVHNGLPVG